MIKGLSEALDLLARGRNNLVKSYTEKNSDRYRYSFRYDSSPVALGVAGQLLDHQWLDNQLMDAHDRFERKEISNHGWTLFIHAIQKLTILHSDDIVFEGYKSLLAAKMNGLKTLLVTTEAMNQKLRSLEFDIFRDKVLFEREMAKYDNKVAQK